MMSYTWHLVPSAWLSSWGVGWRYFYSSPAKSIELFPCKGNTITPNSWLSCCHRRFYLSTKRRILCFVTAESMMRDLFLRIKGGVEVKWYKILNKPSNNDRPLWTAKTFNVAIFCDLCLRNREVIERSYNIKLKLFQIFTSPALSMSDLSSNAQSTSQLINFILNPILNLSIPLCPISSGSFRFFSPKQCEGWGAEISHLVPL